MARLIGPIRRLLSSLPFPFARPLRVVGSARKTPLPVIKSPIRGPFSSQGGSNSQEVSFGIKLTGPPSVRLNPPGDIGKTPAEFQKRQVSFDELGDHP